MSNLYYTGTQEQIDDALAQINTNCGFPDGEGTDTWAIPESSYSDHDFWFIPMPPENGYKNSKINFTQAEMILGVINVDINPYNSNWFPPINPPQS